MRGCDSISTGKPYPSIIKGLGELIACMCMCDVCGGVGWGAEGGSSRLSGKNLQVCTVQQLKAMLKEMNLPLKGNKVLS